jgi:hypothetical protein
MQFVAESARSEQPMPLEPGARFGPYEIVVGTDVDLVTNYDVTSDGRLLINMATDPSTSAPIPVVLNLPSLLQE